MEKICSEYIRKQRYVAIEESKNFYIYMDRKNKEYVAVKKGDLDEI